ncbi:MAG: signal peptidase I [Planctomycetota bacterium]
MSLSETEKSSSRKAPRKNKVAEIANTFEWLITAFVLAFVFRAFVMEAFRIPTGSMADTLKGAHFRLCCRQCGYKYDRGFIPQNYRLRQDTVPHGSRTPPTTRCPSCGYYQPVDNALPVANGDRILVLKCIYQFFEPKQWDVIVFKNPLEPSINYIKRLVGLPGDIVEIIDGDIYIDGRISRKPPKVQKELWMPVYNNDYQPVRPRERSFNNHIWQQPFKNIADSKWILNDKDNPTLFCLDSGGGQIHSLIYDTSIGNNFRATYAYDDVGEYRHQPFCSDLMVRFSVRSAESQGRIGMALSKYQTRYRAWVDCTQEIMVIEEVDKDGKEEELNRKPIESPAINKATLIKFANVDHQLIFEFGSEKLVYDLEDTDEKRTDIEPEVRIFGSGKLTLSHIAIFRDIHYTAKRSPNSREQGRATQGNAFPLEDDEFFVLGDNSPNSEDGRWWRAKGLGINGEPLYREGVVPRDYLVGKALFVYWPSGFRPFAKSRFAVIPNVGRMRFIYGGSNNTD